MPVQLADHVERVADIVRMTAGNGVARARLELHPLDLGTVDVRLRCTVQGLVASISVDRPETLQAVTRAGAELQQQLADRGLNLLRLDISLGAGAPAGQETAGQAGARQDGRAGAASAAPRADAAAEAGDDDLSLSIHGPSVTTLAPGALVDVRA